MFWGEPGWEPPGDEGLMFTGGENAFPFNTIAKPSPRGHIPQMANKRAGEASACYMLMKPLVDTATSLGVRAVYDVHASASVVQSDGRVVRLRRSNSMTGKRSGWPRRWVPTWPTWTPPRWPS